jgi:hypothetical protein
VTKSLLPRKAVLRRLALLVVAGALGVGQLSCATTALTPDTTPMPAARAGLRPEYRVFYDAMTDYGDWILIEPYGFVFRPRVNFDVWNPYYDGFWSPTDMYGWVWVSAEPFGWATYHYGRWFRDDFQGWVWVPGVDWAPAWVTWNTNETSVAWAPLGPNSTWTAPAQGAQYNVIARQDLGSPELKAKIVTGEQAQSALAGAESVRNLDQTNGVTYNRGPRIDWVERVTGPLRRAQLEDLVAPQSPGAVSGRVRGAGQRSAPGTGTTVGRESPMQHAADEATQRARSLIQQKQMPASLPVVRPFGPAQRGAGARRDLSPPGAPAGKPTPQKSAGDQGSPPDSTR